MKKILDNMKAGIESGLKKAKAKNTYVSGIENDDLRALARVMEMGMTSLPPDQWDQLCNIAVTLSDNRKKSMGLDCGSDCFFQEPYGFVPNAACDVHG
jgi:hypothetical protein